MTGHRGKGKGPARGFGNGNPRAPMLDTSPEKQRARALKRWADHRERVAQGPDAVEAHRRVIALNQAKLKNLRERRAIRASLPPRACSGGSDGS